MVAPSSLMDQMSSNQVRLKVNELTTKQQVYRRMEAIRTAAAAAFTWMDSHEHLRRELAARSRPPHYTCLTPGTQICFHRIPQTQVWHRRLEGECAGWCGPAIVVRSEDLNHVCARWRTGHHPGGRGERAAGIARRDRGLGIRTCWRRYANSQINWSLANGLKS